MRATLRKRSLSIMLVVLGLLGVLVPAGGRHSVAKAAAPEAHAAVYGSLQLSSPSGQPSVPLQEVASGCGYATSASIAVTIYSSNKVPVASPAISNLVSQFSGCYRFSFTFPGLPADTYTVYAAGTNGNTDTGQVIISSGPLVYSLLLSSSYITSGQSLTGQVCGFPAGFTALQVTVTSAAVTYVNTNQPVTVSSGCYFVPIPTTGLPLGSFTVAIYGSSYSASAPVVVNASGSQGGTLVLSTINGYAGEAITATACNFTPNLSSLLVTVINAVNVAFSNAEAVTTTLNGCYIVSVPTSGLSAGNYTVTVSNGTIESASAVLLLSSAQPGAIGSLTLNVSNAAPGALVMVTGCGFSASDTLALSISSGATPAGATAVPLAAGPTLAGTAIYGSSCYSVQFYVPAGLPAGTYYLFLQGSPSGTIDSTVLPLTGAATTGATVLTASSSTVAPGGNVTLYGSGFSSNAVVTISGLGVLQVQSSATGTFTTMLSVPQGTATGLVSLSAVDSLGHTASTSITIGPALATGSIQAAGGSAAAGQPVSVSGQGFAPNEQVTISLGTSTTVSSAIVGTGQVFTSLPNGTFTVLYQVQNMSPGLYYLLAHGLSSGATASTPFTVLAAVTATPPVTPPVTAPVVPQPPSIPLPAIAAAASIRYFAAGYTGTIAANGKASFNEHLYFYNPGSAPAVVTTHYSVFDPAANAYTQLSKTDTVAGGATVARSVNQDVGADRMVSAVVQASPAVAAEETVTRTNASGTGLDAASSPGSSQLNTTWYLAEGYTGATFQEYVTVFNPGDTAAAVHIQYLPSDTVAPGAVSQKVPAHGLVTINVRSQYNKLMPRGSKNVSIKVTADVPVAVDRELYWGAGAGSAKYGYSLTPAVAAGAISLYFASLTTAGSAQTFLAAFNPNDTAATVSLKLLNSSGATIKTLSASVRPHARYTFVLTGGTLGTSDTLAGIVSSNRPIVAEASLYFGGTPNSGMHPGTVVQGGAGYQIAARADGTGAGGLLYVFNSGSSDERVQVTAGSQVVSDALVSPATVRVLQLSDVASSQGILVRSSGTVTASFIVGGVAGGQTWGGNLGPY